MNGLSTLFRRLSRASAAQKSAIALAVPAFTLLGGVIGGALDSDVLGAAFGGLVLSLLPIYLILTRGGGRQLSYSLSVPPAPQQAASYREATPLLAAQLVARLAKYGYRLEVALLDSSGRPAGAAPASTALIGAPLFFREPSERHGGIVIALPLAGGLAPLEVVGDRRGVYAELARYLILELGELVRGIEFKESFSSLSPESTEWLRCQVPDRPLALRR